MFFSLGNTPQATNHYLVSAFTKQAKQTFYLAQSAFTQQAQPAFYLTKQGFVFYLASPLAFT